MTLKEFLKESEGKHFVANVTFETKLKALTLKCVKAKVSPTVVTFFFGKDNHEKVCAVFKYSLCISDGPDLTLNIYPSDYSRDLTYSDKFFRSTKADYTIRFELFEVRKLDIEIE